MNGSGFLSMFDDMLAALDHEFAFLVNDYGFSRSEPKQFGRECALSYYRAPYVELSISQEPLGSPFLELYVKDGALEESWAFTPLRLIARKRNPNWVEPELPSQSRSEAELRAYFRNYADLLKENFQDVLTVGPA